jgi:hypothetical protein
MQVKWSLLANLILEYNDLGSSGAEIRYCITVSGATPVHHEQYLGTGYLSLPRIKVRLGLFFSPLPRWEVARHQLISQRWFRGYHTPS